MEEGRGLAYAIKINNITPPPMAMRSLGMLAI
jgi:hypothetical protein